MNTPEKKEIEKGFYQHFKGNLYEVLDTVIHSETLENYVLYKPVSSDTLWIRHYNMFFETVEHQGQVIKRFQKVHEGEHAE